MKSFFSLLLSYIPLLCCGQIDSNYFDLSIIHKCWTNSREEATESSIFIYRPCDYKIFPTSRFRDHIEFEENGKCSFLYLAPNDAHHMVKGEWAYDKLNKLIVIKDKFGKIVYNFKVISIKDDLLKVEQQK